MGIEQKMTEEIIATFEDRLGRKLSELEVKTLQIPRGLIGYESILDTAKYEGHTREYLEDYLGKLT